MYRVGSSAIQANVIFNKSVTISSDISGGGLSGKAVLGYDTRWETLDVGCEHATNKNPKMMEINDSGNLNLKLSIQISRAIFHLIALLKGITSKI